MEIIRLVSGPFETNTYILKSGSDVAIIDPAFLDDSVFDIIGDSLKYVINTHGHIDHIHSNDMILDRYKEARLLIHKLDGDFLSNPSLNLSIFLDIRLTSRKADLLLDEGSEIDIGNCKGRVLHTPGHTPGSICLYFEKEGILFSGDTIFNGGIGRTDFPGGDESFLWDSIKRIESLGSGIHVYPGHGSDFYL